jgi:crossover junction endodeoxyribonuclease RuvC
MIVLGVDPGSHTTGYGVISTRPRLGMLAGGVIRTAADQALAERLRIIHDGIAAVLAEHRPDAMAVENLFNARNARASLILGHARGVVLLAGACAALNVAEYTPGEVKKAVTGNGGAAKEQVRFMVMRLLALRESPPLDQSDALAVAIAYVNRSRGGLTARGGCA